jgi:hypothetical protein
MKGEAHDYAQGPIESGFTSRALSRPVSPASQLICHHHPQWLFFDPSTDCAPREMPEMSDVEDYPGPSRQPAKNGQDPRGRADEGMVKPPVSPVPKKGKSRKQKQKQQ